MIHKIKMVLLIIIVGAQLTIIYIVCRSIYQNKKLNKDVLGAISISPINRENLIFPPDAQLKYYYESSPSATKQDNPIWLGYTATYTINNDSLNERFNYTVEKPKNVFRIVTLGDSFTFGLFVNTADNWTERLEDKLNKNINCVNINKFEVINLGEQGYDVQYIAHKYALRGVKYNPDLIIWFESGSGFDRMVEFMKSYIDKYDKTLTFKKRDDYKSEGVYYLAWDLALNELHKTDSEERILDQVGDWWNNFFQMRGNVPVLITTFENLSSQNKAKLKRWTKDQPNVYVMANIKNLSPADRLPDGHPNVHGYELIAQDTFSPLLHSGLIPCESSQSGNLQ